eukprot:TRINITY_DN7689_c0_g1_i3.p1 TRINITY_DN7689_c0_g1~~TRINITY_DN7689_c0_g1_i3.p1  ORF type:complete len:236 (+),score=25.63 TRINITY_DN7689_c0_g1_i3:96-803(+)
MSVLTFNVSCSTANVRSERRFEKSTSVISMKEKLELVVGVPAGSMRLVVKGDDGQQVCELSDNSAMLGAYPVADYMNLHVINTDGGARVGEFDDVSQVQKYELTDEEYASKRDTVLDFKKRNKLGRFNPELQAQEATQLAGEAESASRIKKGDRCEVKMKTGGTQRGTVRYSGETAFAKGSWIGVELDEPFGKHDGEVKGQRYFQCQPKYGGFFKPSAIVVGDFPPEDDFSDDEM